MHAFKRSSILPYNFVLHNQKESIYTNSNFTCKIADHNLLICQLRRFTIKSLHLIQTFFLISENAILILFHLNLNVISIISFHLFICIVLYNVETMVKCIQS